MSISNDCYRAAIGTWHLLCLSRKTKPTKTPLPPIKIKFLLSLLLNSYGIFLGMLLLLKCGDVHPKPGPTFENKSIKICHINIQSLYIRAETHHRRKIDEIESFVANAANYDIICLSETWLDPQIETSLVDIQGFSFLRKDRLGRAGGVGLYISDALPRKRLYELEFPETDLMWIELLLGHKKILIGACYRPPGQSADEVELFLSDFSDSVDMAFQLKPESIFILGDLNDTCQDRKSVV
jgi:hypothetical protein